MKIKRRNFLKRIISLTLGYIVIPPVISKRFESYADSKPVEPIAKPSPDKWTPDNINIAWIGHSTILLNFYGTIILTDPVLFARIGLYFWGMTYGPSRYSAPALYFDELPKPDIILLSHAHMDHMDYKTLLKITEKYPNQIDCITAYNTKDVIEDLKWNSLKEIDWEEEHFISDIKFKALEVKHFGWRFPWEKDRSRGFMKEGRSYNAYLIEKNGNKILFGGDTAFTKKLSRQNNEEVDIAIMPIGAYYPWRKNHCNPEEALIMATKQLNARHFIPIHCNTFKQGFEPIDEPINWLAKISNDYNIQIEIYNIGETFTCKI